MICVVIALAPNMVSTLARTEHVVVKEVEGTYTPDTKLGEH